ncbi:unnamed protein product [Calicophoron daubneyi]|uniref:Adenylate kinase n=1 Tax=Calicophoron daubneyi TaxID=300641 RepID=A0AAV2T5E6_CALDB
MKIKVVTTFSYRADNKDGQNGERFISSALTVESDVVAAQQPQQAIDYQPNAQLKGPTVSPDGAQPSPSPPSVTQGSGSPHELYPKGSEGKPEISNEKPLPKDFGKVSLLKAPRFMVIGKPCTGKTTLARQLCAQFNCELVNASDLIEYHLSHGTDYGKKIEDTLKDGHDLDDELVLSILRDKLMSPECVNNGYVIDGIPTHSEGALSIEKQLELIFSLDNGPNYLIDIQISNDALRDRWEEMRIDYESGAMYPKESYITDEERASSPPMKYYGHPDFPKVEDETRERLLIRHEELPENLEKHFKFYDSKVQTKVDDFLAKYDPNSVISVDGRVSPTERFEETMSKLQKASTRSAFKLVQPPPAPAPAVTSSLSLSRGSHQDQSSRSRTEESSLTISSIPLPAPEVPSDGKTAYPESAGRMSWAAGFRHLLSESVIRISFDADKTVWQGRTPRLVLLGKPCTGKTPLARFLCNAWECSYLNATNLINEHLAKHTPKGGEILKILQDGKDLSDSCVLELLTDQLKSTECRAYGYVLDGLPTYSEKQLTVSQQIDFLGSLEPEPYFFVVIEIPDEDLRKRWGSVRIDYATGRLYTGAFYAEPGNVSDSCDFPKLDEPISNRLITRIEEVPENLDKHFEFYNQRVNNELEAFLSRLPEGTVIRLDGRLCPSALGEALITKLRLVVQQFGLKAATLKQEPAFVRHLSSQGSGLISGTEQFLSSYPVVDPYSSTAHCPVLSTETGVTTTQGKQSDSIKKDGSPENPPRILSADSTGRDQFSVSYPSLLEPKKSPSNLPSMSTNTSNVCPDHKGCAAGGYRMGDTCPQCGINISDCKLSDLWENGPPRIMITGKPCTGKSGLAKMICETWDCVLADGTSFIREHIEKNDDYGQKVTAILREGGSLPDELITSILKDALESRDFQTKGFVIDDCPMYDRRHLTVPKQLEFLDILGIRPNYIVSIDVPNEILACRWSNSREGVRKLTNFDLPREVRVVSSTTSDSGAGNAAPPPDQLMTTDAELIKYMDPNIKFYYNDVIPVLDKWLDTNYKDKIIPLDGATSTKDMFKMLQMKLHMITHHPDVPLGELFGTLPKCTRPGQCCHRCGCRFATPQPAPDIWAEEPPRIVIFGKPCTGKTTLARRLCAHWNCQLVNATDLITYHLKANTTLGQRIRATMNEGKDLTDQFVFCILREKLLSPGCTEGGYVLDGVPTHSEKSHSIANQMEFLESLEPPPNYLIHIRIPDDVLRQRWGATRIDVNDGTLYRKCSHDCTKTPHTVRHPDFPELDQEVRERLITRHEELAENLDKHFQFYHAHMSPAINEFLKKHDASKVIDLDGTQSTLSMLHTLLYELSVMQRHPGVPTSKLFNDIETPPPPPVECPCLKHELHHYEPLADPWVEKPPRILILGMPCTGKTTLAKRLCATWGCELITATELINSELKRGCEMGEQIRAKLVAGQDLDDALVIELFKKALVEHSCKEHGYIMEGIPNHSELSLTIRQQLDLLKNLPNGPEYVIYLHLTDKQLRERWEDMRIDIEDGALYSKYNYVDKTTCLGRWTRHPDFPVVDDATKERLITRHEELEENLDKHFEFYHRVMDEHLQWFLASFDPSTVLNVDADLSPSELLQDVLLRFSVMARHPGVPTTTLFEIASDESGDTTSSCQCTCGEKRAPKDDIHISRDFWKDRVPKIMIIGNSCCGKTTLAKKMVKDWGCVLINASELIQNHLSEKTPIGREMEEVMKKGEDLKDTMVLDMLKEHLTSSDCIKRGFVIDDIPTSSEKALPIWDQIKMLNDVGAQPDFVIDIRLQEKDLLNRWEAIRIDLQSGALYGGERALRMKPAAHPTFPASSARIRQRLITRHEEILENVEKQDLFYRQCVRPVIDAYLNELGHDAVICVDGRLPPGELYRTAYNAIREHLGT